MNMHAENDEAGRGISCAVLDGGEIALVRISGRGCFSNSLAMKRFASHAQKRGADLKFIVDLKDCDSMDSTFMGVMAGIVIHHTQNKMPKVIVINAGDHCKKCLKNLGLLPLLDVRAGHVKELDRAEDALAPAPVAEPSRLDQICLTLQAHQQLVKLDEQNEVRFQAVIEYLEKSLEEEKGGGECKA